MTRMDEKKLHTGNFSWSVAAETWDASCFKKGLLEKQQSVPNTCAILPLEKIFYQNLTVNRWIFQIPLKYIKLVIPKILFMLVLCSFNFYFKIMWPPLPPPLSPPKLKFLTLPPARFFSEIFNPPFPSAPSWRGVHALKAQLKLSPLIQNRVQQDYLPESYARHLPSYQIFHKIVALTRCGLFYLPLNLYGKPWGWGKVLRSSQNFTHFFSIRTIPLNRFKSFVIKSFISSPSNSNPMEFSLAAIIFVISYFKFQALYTHISC